MNILIAEDEERMRRLVKDFLTKEGYTVLEAADGQEAMDIIESKLGQISLVILDVMMPNYIENMIMKWSETLIMVIIQECIIMTNITKEN